MKASLILSILEEEVQKGVLVRKSPAIYLLDDRQKRQELLGLPAERERGPISPNHRRYPYQGASRG